MKTFINVLYRKILYKIPLKFLLLILVIVWVLYYNFSSAVETYDTISAGDISLNGNATQTFLSADEMYYKDTFCMMNNGSTNCNFTATYWWKSVTINQYRMVGCLIDIEISSSVWVSIHNNSNSRCEARFISVNSKDWWPDYTSLQCQTEYNLIPISSVDQNYCTTNNLCPSQDCPVCPPSWWSWYSNVYINDILHIWAPNIIMNIAEEIDRDYAYTASWYNMNIDVVWYNVDYDKIDSIVENQSYKPSSEDFVNILWILAPYTKIIVFFVFLFLVWAWIKKPFKSKKL